MYLWCAHAGHRWLDRCVCPAPCEALHVRCARCGSAVGGCVFERPEQQERVIDRIAAIHGCDADSALGIVAAIQTAARLGRPMSFTIAQQFVRDTVDRPRGVHPAS
jgi:hypothetical protein